MKQQSKGLSLIPTRARTKETARSESGGFASGILYGLAFCAVSGLAALILSAIIAYASPDPDALITPLGFGAMILSCLLGGVGVGLKCRSGVLPCALVTGCAYVGLGLLLGLFFGGELREALTLGLGLGASLGIRAGLVALFCAAAALIVQIKAKLASQPRRLR